MMRPIDEWPLQERSAITHIFTDLDETLTSHGSLKASVYQALENLTAAGIDITVVTGRPAGWCDLIARIWPVAATIAESGGIAIRHKSGITERLYWQNDNQEGRLQKLKEEALARFPFARLSSDSHYREIDIAFDHSEEKPGMTKEQIATLAHFFKSHGAEVTTSSIHLHAWFGDFNKFEMSKKIMNVWWKKEIRPDSPYLFIGDSLNDASMFAHFPKTIGVANIKKVAEHLPRQPLYVTKAEAGEGFLEVARMLLDNR